LVSHSPVDAGVGLMDAMLGPKEWVLVLIMVMLSMVAFVTCQVKGFNTVGPAGAVAFDDDLYASVLMVEVVMNLDDLDAAEAMVLHAWGRLPFNNDGISMGLA
jgi:hypothetical protein